MNKELVTMCEELENDIKTSYENGVTMQEAEKLAGKFLHAMMRLAPAISANDLDCRMKKSGVKAIRAAVYLDAATQGEKKPSDVLLGNLVDQDKTVQDTQQLFDKAEVSTDELKNYYNIFKEAHVHFRTIAKGAFNG